MTIRDLIASLRESRAGHLDELERINDGVKAAGRKQLTAEEDARYTELLELVREENVRIQELQSQDDRDQSAAAAMRRTHVSETKPTGMEMLFGGALRDQYAASVYFPGSPNSYFRDLVAAQVRGDFDARQRLSVHKTEVERAIYVAERRDLTRTDGAGGEFVPPLWLMEELAGVPRAGRVTADRMTIRPLPPGTDSINIPKVATGGAVGVQTADNAAVTEVDPTTTSIAAPVRTIAGQVDVAIQLLDQSPAGVDEIIFADLLEDYFEQLDTQVLTGTGAGGQVTGLLNTAGVLTITYTDADPTLPELWVPLAKSVSQLASSRKLPAECIVMHPSRWGWILSTLDSQNRPLVVPDQGQGPMNAIAVETTPTAEGLAGRMLGLPVYLDGNIPQNLGGGTNEDRILVLRGSDHRLYESFVRTRVLPEVGSGTLTVRLQLWNYVAFTAARYPASTAIIAGTGLVVPAGF